LGLVLVCVPLSACNLFDSPSNELWDGAPLGWNLPRGRGGGTPAFDGSTVYYIGRDHRVYAEDGRTGHAIWSAATGNARGAPCCGNCVVVNAVVACGDLGIAAFRRADGTRVWNFFPGDNPGVFPLVVTNGVIFAGSRGGGRVYAIDAATGALRWTAQTLDTVPERINIVGVQADSDIVVGAFLRQGRPFTGGIVAMDAQTGAVRWTTEFPSAGPDSDSAAFSVALWRETVVGASYDGKIYLMDRTTGAIQSFFPGVGFRPPSSFSPYPVGEDFRALLVHGDTLYASSFADWFVAYDLESPRELWRIATPRGSSLGSPLVTDGRAVYDREGFGYLAAFSATGPKVLWTSGTSQYEQLTAGVAVSGDMVFGAGDQGFWAIKKQY
jgi:outer membrane protein assembly factor BamB